ncbi:unnamed protein product [Brassicogethes aeneus]|uniref:C2H2-type domain-containing protein n=1 Tax=Brassicogethes aeneus TaxID=1431903 RepID=A0A9P0BCX9_BRAAE|nr:unnamed protein product [Brassicogethes aeneus]
MPNPCNHRCDHNENRKKICAPCGRKISLGSKMLEHFRITDHHELLIKQFINANFDLSNPKFPSGICVTCRQILQEHERGIVRRSVKNMPNYEDICLPKETRNTPISKSFCNCYICLTGRHQGHINIKKKLPVCKTLDLSIKITPNNGMYGSQNSSITQIPKKETMKPIDQKTLTICQVCYQEVGKGKNHPCIRDSSNNKAQARQNVQELASALPKKQQEQLCVSLLSQKIENMKSSTADFQNIVSLSTQGRKKTIFLKASDKPKTISVESLNDYQVISGASGKQMKNLSHFIRDNMGRKAVPAYYSVEVSKRAKLLAELYHHDVLDFDVEKCLVKQRRPVVWGNAEEILQNIIDRRNLIGNYGVKVMADGGQGFFKISMSVIPKSYISECLSDQHGESSSSKKIKIDKCTSVHKLTILALVPNIKETYENLKILFDLVKINDISIKFVSDFKLLLLVNGQQTATSLFPCPYCFINLQDLRDRKDLNDQTNNHENPEKNQEYISNKTYGDLRRDYEKFTASGTELKMDVLRERGEKDNLEKQYEEEEGLISGMSLMCVRNLENVAHHGAKRLSKVEGESGEGCIGGRVKVCGELGKQGLHALLNTATPSLNSATQDQDTATRWTSKDQESPASVSLR